MKACIKNIKLFIINLLFPNKCPYCSDIIEYNQFACENCKSKFPKEIYFTYAKGGYKCVTPFIYKDIYKKAVHQFKFKNCGSYARQLSYPLSESIIKNYVDESFDFVTCVPMHKKSLKKRGYNQAELLAKECAERLNLPYAETLIKFKENQPQHTLPTAQKAENVKGVYKITDKMLVKGKRILIIDDIITTGHTLGECAKILAEAESKQISCAAICMTNYQEQG